MCLCDSRSHVCRGRGSTRVNNPVFNWCLWTDLSLTWPQNVHDTFMSEDRAPSETISPPPTEHVHLTSQIKQKRTGRQLLHSKMPFIWESHTQQVPLMCDNDQCTTCTAHKTHFPHHQGEKAIDHVVKWVCLIYTHRAVETERRGSQSQRQPWAQPSKEGVKRIRGNKRTSNNWSQPHLEDIREESRANPLTGEVIQACETGEGADQSPVGRWPHPAHLQKIPTDWWKQVAWVIRSKSSAIICLFVWEKEIKATLSVCLQVGQELNIKSDLNQDT